MAFFNKLNPFGAPGLRTLGKMAPIKKLGMSPSQSPAPTPGIGPSAGGAAQDMATNFMGKMGMKQPMINQMNQKIDYSKLPNGGWSERPMNGPAINRGGASLPWGRMRGGGMQQVGNMRSPWEMGGMAGRLGSTTPLPPQEGQSETPQPMMGPQMQTPGINPGGMQPWQTPGGVGQGVGPSPDMLRGRFGRGMPSWIQRNNGAINM